MSRAAIIGLPRYPITPTSGASFASGLGASNLSTWEPWEIARMLTPDPRLAYLDCAISVPTGYAGNYPIVGGVGVVNHSLGLLSTARAIMIREVGSGSYILERVIPNLVTAITGTWTGTAANIDEDIYPEDLTDQVTCTSSGSFQRLRIDYATPASNPIAGAGLQLLRFRFRWDKTPSDLTIELRESGGAVIYSQVLIGPGYGTFTADKTSELYFVPFDASILVTASGANLQADVVATLPASANFRIETADWLADRGIPTDVVVYDSLWKASAYDRLISEFGNTPSGAVAGAPQQTWGTVNPSGNDSVDRLILMFRDPENSSGVLDIGELLIGPAFVPAINVAYGKFVGGEFRDTRNRLDGGQLAGIRREAVRDLAVRMLELLPSEAHALQQRLWRAGSLQPYVVLLRPDTEEEIETSIYGVTKAYPDLSAPNYGRRTLEFVVEEKL